jgi:transcriptional regulator with XRE-family HTH domain
LRVLCPRRTVLLMSHTGHAGIAVRIFRQKLGLSLRDLASESGTSFSYLAQVERGERVPTERWLRDIEAALAKKMGEAA